MSKIKQYLGKECPYCHSSVETIKENKVKIYHCTGCGKNLEMKMTDFFRASMSLFLTTTPFTYIFVYKNPQGYLQSVMSPAMYVINRGLIFLIAGIIGDFIYFILLNKKRFE